MNQNKNNEILLRNYPEALGRKEPRFTWMPGLVVSIGVLGTFVGISIGLMDMDLVEPGQSGATDDLIASIGSLLDGMKTAFLSSVVGILGSIILILCRNLAKLFYGLNHKKALHILNKNRIRLYGYTDRLEQDGSQALVDAAKVMGESVKGFNANAVADRLNESLSPILSDISKELAKLSEIKKENGQEVLQAMMTDMREQVIEPIRARLDTTADLVTHSTESIHELSNILSPLGDQLSKTVEDLQLHQKAANEQIEGVLSKFQQEVGVKLSEQLTNAGTILNETLEKLNGDLATHLETLASLATRIPSLDTALTSNIENLLREMATVSKSLLDNYRKATEEQTNQVRALGENMHNCHEISKDFLNDYIKDVGNASTKVNSELLNVAKYLANAATMAQSNDTQRREEYVE